MYILQNKSQLNSFVNSIRDQSLESFRFSPKPTKLKELISRCLSFNTYASVISKLPIDMEEFDYTFPKLLSDALIAQPYGLRVDYLIMKTIYDNAIENCAYWDDERALMSLHMAADGM
ncbi:MULTISPECIES: hypothetical protein [unclassified Colwellia]|uniref:hypothetical protein n=1 Tax=unclassified Colwellia TaxID=196834 RepID=UPI0015F63FB1|nr:MULTISPECIES: hypothetical protein [unclassified Colwellia]MBA6287860.1 hypothetical protein [Colwellia sp. MB3u-4]MBA6296102.1 hypothetical protein [Colwellia sp. MB02u-9]